MGKMRRKKANGKKSRLLLVVNIFAMDIGGTKIACGIYDEKLNLIREWKVPTGKSLSDIEGVVLKACRRAIEEGAVAVGISAAGNVKPDGRTIAFSTNIPCWIDYPLAKIVEEDFKIPVVVENDANAAGWAEFTHGSGQGSSNMVMVTLGTGMGGALILNKELYHGSFGMAGEVGHIPLVSSGLPCGCGLFGCAEKYSSGNALETMAKQAVRRDPEAGKKLLDISGGRVDKITGSSVFAAAEAGDELSMGIFCEIGAWLGKTLAAISAVLDPDTYVLGGSVATPLLLSKAQSAYPKFLQASSFRPHAEIKLAKFSGDAGLIGVADLVLKKIIKE